MKTSPKLKIQDQCYLAKLKITHGILHTMNASAHSFGVKGEKPIVNCKNIEHRS